MTDESFWDSFYTERDRVWSGRPNAVLAREVAALTPGTELDLSCGEGADAVWLAARGWRVTAVDISRVALARAAAHAAEAGVADRIDFRRADLDTDFPAGRFDLVTAQFLPREKVLRAAADAVAPDGVLLIEGHLIQEQPGHRHHDVRFPTPEDVVTMLGLDSGEWEVLRADRHAGAHDIPEAPRDSTVMARRRVS
jgi:SAM-dependent methyltransferase